MSKFRNISAQTRSAEYGIATGPRWVDPDDVITVSDEVDRKGRKGRDPKDPTGRTMIVVREDHTYADGYRDQATIWEEVLDTDKPAPAPEPEPEPEPEREAESEPEAALDSPA
jgi:hypothetical protein